MTKGIYELPLNERLRTFMRIEFLYERLKYFSQESSGPWAIRSSIHSLLEIYSILSRTDVRREVLADLERFIVQMERFQNVPDADSKIATDILLDLENIKNNVDSIGTGYLEPLRNNEFISSLLHRHTLPGGKAEFDMPKYKHWLESGDFKVKRLLDSWINEIEPICMGIEKLLWLIRESAEPIGTVAVDGLYNHQIERKTQISLVRIFLKVKSIYPEISGGKHLIAVRFFEYDSKSDESYQYKSNVNFKISLC